MRQTYNCQLYLTNIVNIIERNKQVMNNK